MPTLSIFPSPSVLSISPSIKPTNVQPSIHSDAFPTIHPSILSPASSPPISLNSPSARPVIISSTPTIVQNNTNCRPTLFPTIKSSSSSPPALELPTLSITPYQYEKFRGSLFLLGRPSSGSNQPGLNILKFGDNVLNHEAFLLFGQKKGKFRHITLGSQESQGLYTILHESSLFFDDESRSSTLIGDINSDGIRDLLIGYPDLSKVQLFLGILSATAPYQNIPLSLTILGSVGDDFGWASCPVGDYNRDGFDDFLVSAKSTGVVYFFYGGPSLLTKGPSLNLYQNFTNDYGWKIIGTEDTVNTGLAISSAGDFNGDGSTDFLISALSYSSQGIIYLLFGNISNRADIHLNKFGPSMGYLFLAPVLSFCGLSLTSIGDWNQDLYDDIAIGSLPYDKGHYLAQMTMIIFGRSINFTSSNYPTLLTKIIEGEEGFYIVGGGFHVMNIGDRTNDNLPELLVINYPTWYYHTRGNAFIVVDPTERNITTHPSFGPSSAPTSIPSDQSTAFPSIPISLPTNQPSIDFSNDDSLISTTRSPYPVVLGNISTNTHSSLHPTQTKKKSFRPSIPKTQIPSRTPITNFPTKIKSLVPTTTEPTLLTKTTLLPTTMSQISSHPTKSRQIRPTQVPTIFPTSYPTYSDDSDSFTTIKIDREGEYIVDSSLKNILFLIQSDGKVTITGSLHGKNIFKCIPIREGADRDSPIRSTIITLTHFKVSSDTINIIEFTEFTSYQDIPFSTNPLRYYLAKNYEIILLSFMSASSSSSISNSVARPPLNEVNFQTSIHSNSDTFGNQLSSADLITVCILMSIILIFFLFCVFGEKFDIDKDIIVKDQVDDKVESNNQNQTAIMNKRDVEEDIERSDSLDSHWISLLEDENLENSSLVHVESGHNLNNDPFYSEMITLLIDNDLRDETLSRISSSFMLSSEDDDDDDQSI